MDLRFLRLRRWLLKQQPNKTVFNRFIRVFNKTLKRSVLLGRRIAASGHCR